MFLKLVIRPKLSVSLNTYEQEEKLLQRYGDISKMINIHAWRFSSL